MPESHRSGFHCSGIQYCRGLKASDSCLRRQGIGMPKGEKSILRVKNNFTTLKKGKRAEEILLKDH
jgi:hypothetical protein